MKIYRPLLVLPLLLLFTLSFRVLATETQNNLSLVLACKVQNIITMPVDGGDYTLDNESWHNCRGKELSSVNCQYESDILFEFFGNRETGYIYREGSYGVSLERSDEWGAITAFKSTEKYGAGTTNSSWKDYYYIFNRRSGRVFGYDSRSSANSLEIERTSLGKCKVEGHGRLF